MPILHPNIHSAVPVIATDDIDKSITYYVQILGFEFDFKYGDPPVYAGVNSGSTEIYFTKSPDLVFIIKEKNLNPEVFIWVSDADKLFKEHVENGAEIVEPIEDRAWKARQYVIKDINGYLLKFVQPI